jgi:hypothetical protein
MAITNLPEPRAHLDGLELPNTFKLPDLNLVWQDAQQGKSRSCDDVSQCAKCILNVFRIAPLIRAEKYEPVKMIDGKTGQWEMMPECLYRTSSIGSGGAYTHEVVRRQPHAPASIQICLLL